MNNDVAASGGVPGAAIFVSVFFIKIGFVAVGAEHDVRHPVRRSAHLLADHIQVNIRAVICTAPKASSLSCSSVSQIRSI